VKQHSHTFGCSVVGYLSKLENFKAVLILGRRLKSIEVTPKPCTKVFCFEDELIQAGCT
jgi:hypothetical protein